MSGPAASQAPDPVIGLAAIGRLVFERSAELQPLFERLRGGLDGGPGDAARMMDLSTILLATGNRDQGLELQALALSTQRLYRVGDEAPGALKLLALTAPGDLMANTPVEFLIEGSGVELTLLFIDGDGGLPEVLPGHDVALLAAGESAANFALLRALEPRVASWPRPIVNGAPGRISELTRDGVCALLEGAPGLVAPAAVRLDRASFERLTAGALPMKAVLPDADFPIIARPIGSHAGTGLVKLGDLTKAADYLAAQAEEGFYVSPFVDYSGSDGLFRKQRIALIDGRPFVCHHAVSEHWMVHYLSAGMLEHAERREEEARFMADFDTEYAVRHRAAFAALAERIGLDYFAIDCAETRDGRLLLFEADVAMIVHAMDPPDLFPYKPAQMRKVFDAFLALLKRKAIEGV